MKDEKYLNEDETSRALEKLQDLGEEELAVLEKILGTLKGLDLSVDQLAAMFSGRDVFATGVAQDTYGRLPLDRMKPNFPQTPSEPSPAPAPRSVRETVDREKTWSDHQKMKMLTENFRKWNSE
tara:strand:+ start:1264 stop:1635 length:372 start_codon:yes stop_codon:yes gene_type:complete